MRTQHPRGASRQRSTPRAIICCRRLTARKVYADPWPRLDTKGQVTLLVTAEQLQLIDALFDRESGCVRGLYSESQGQTVKSYRYQIVGLLLHNPLLQELQKQ